MNINENKKRKKLLTMYIVFFWLCTITIIFSVDYTVWLMEVLPAYLGFLAIFILLDKGVTFSKLLNVICVIQILVLTIGGIFTYSKVPFFNPSDSMGYFFGWERNNYDKLGHFMQGITPYVATKELLIRKRIVKRSSMQVFLCISVSLAISALYELFEYTTILISSDFANDFVASQGDSYDTQKDMLFALLGAVFAACVFVNYRYEEESTPS